VADWYTVEKTLYSTRAAIERVLQYRNVNLRALGVSCHHCPQEKKPTPLGELFSANDKDRPEPHCSFEFCCAIDQLRVTMPSFLHVCT
jgi:hypothetical protein